MLTALSTLASKNLDQQVTILNQLASQDAHDGVAVDQDTTEPTLLTQMGLTASNLVSALQQGESEPPLISGTRQQIQQYLARCPT
jgi:hypothetical protein